MFDIKVNTSDLKEKIGLLDTPGMARAIGVAVAEETRNIFARYPPASHARQPFKSAKQRAFVMAAIKRGDIVIPYRRGIDPRSETLGRKWQIEPETDGATLINTASYSDLVHTKGKQAKYHQGNWLTDEDGARQVEQDGTAERIAEKVVVHELEKAGLT